jgi:hypothetical protein
VHPRRLAHSRAGFEPPRRPTSSPGRVHHSVESVRLLPAFLGSALHPVPAITAGHSATRASADFYPFTSDVAVRRAASACGRVRWLIQGFRPGPQSGSRGTPRPPIGQISPDKDMDCRCTTAAFTLSPVPGGLRHLVLTRPGTKPSMRFLSVGSHLCAQTSSRQALAGLPLPSASSYISLEGPYRYSYRGLSPHKSTPMPGGHNGIERDGCFAAAAHANR